MVAYFGAETSPLTVVVFSLKCFLGWLMRSQAYRSISLANASSITGSSEDHDKDLVAVVGLVYCGSAALSVRVV